MVMILSSEWQEIKLDCRCPQKKERNSNQMSKAMPIQKAKVIMGSHNLATISIGNKNGRASIAKKVLRRPGLSSAFVMLSPPLAS